MSYFSLLTASAYAGYTLYSNCCTFNLYSGCRLPKKGGSVLDSGYWLQTTRPTNLISRFRLHEIEAYLLNLLNLNCSVCFLFTSVDFYITEGLRCFINPHYSLVGSN